MTEPSKIDDAEMYFMEFVEETPNEAGGTHIGLFLGWAIERGLAAPALNAQRSGLRARRQTGRDVLFRHCDGKLLTTDLTERGQAFAAHYYQSTYLQDYLRMFGLKDDPADELGKVSDDHRSQEMVSRRLDRRYSEWRMSQGMPSTKVLCDALVRAAGPILEAAGFETVPDTGFLADTTRVIYRHPTAWQQPSIELYGTATADQSYGIGVRIGFDVPEVHHLAVEERQRDQWPYGMADAGMVAMPFWRLVEDWPRPAALDAYVPAIWIFEEAELAPAAAYLASRLQDFALPALARIDSLNHLCDAWNRRPLSDSPWFRSWSDHALPVAFELCGHRGLPGVLKQMRAHWEAEPDVFLAGLMLAFVSRMEARC